MDNKIADLKNRGMSFYGDVNIRTRNESNDTPDITWWYNDDTEKMRIYAPNNATANDCRPYFRIYDNTGTKLYEGSLAIKRDTQLAVYNLETVSVTLSANGGTANATVSISKTDYTALGIVGYQSFSTAVFPYNLQISGTTATAAIRNLGSASVTGKMRIYVLYRHN